MFQDEARVAALVRHPNVVRLLDIGDEQGELFLVLEYVESTSLSILRREASAGGAVLPHAVTSRIMADVLLGLHAAHETVDARGRPLDLVHRDVSPQNVLIGVDGVSQVIDFGIAKASMRLTETTGGAIKGKLSYMSPEQAKGLDIDRRSDVFSAGIVLFELLTGKRLFGANGSDGSNVLLEVLLSPIEAPSLLRPSVPAGADRVVERALERVRDERFQTALELHDALVEAIPPAKPREVADVVERYCGDSLRARRSETRSALEGIPEHGGPRGIPRRPEPLEAIGSQGPTQMTASADFAAATRRRTPVWVAVALALAVASVVVFGVRRRAASSPSISQSPPPTTATITQPPLPATATGTASALPAPASPSAAPSTSATAVVAPMPRVSPRPDRHRPPGSSGAARPSPPPASALPPPQELHPDNPY
jgi:serine/threonine-protein kinase